MKRLYEIIGILLFSIFILSINGINFAALFIVTSIDIIYMCLVINRISKTKNKKWLRIIKNVTNILVAMFIMSFIIIESILVFHITNANQAKDIEKLDYILVLGAGLDGEKVGKTLKARLDKALEYYSYNKDSIFIVSGGQGHDEVISEAEAMYRYLIENGVKSNNIIKEDKATTTLENIKYTKEILIDRNDVDEKILIVTNDFHLLRAKIIGEILNVKNEGLQASTPLKVRVNYLIREYPTMIIDIVRTTIEANIQYD